LKKEEGWLMYVEIQQLKELGLNKSQIARRLGISRPTVDKYIDMSPDEFDRVLEALKQRSKKPEVYHDEILSWLKEFPDLSAAQVYDWLEEKYEKLHFCESTLRRYIRLLRETHNIPKNTPLRQYEAVVDPPMGKQMQVDFGEKKVITHTGNEITLYAMCFVLSNSRYKYCEWLDRPFTTADIIRIHENAFEFYGGIPEEIVYDQDHLILVSENHGDLIYTHEFATYLKKRKFRVYMCRKADPQSKGRIENVVGFVKNNFAHNRTFCNLERWNEDCLKWLERRGNGKMHSTTKKIPAVVFQEEKKYLRPVTEKLKTKPAALSLTYQVRKDNTVPVKGNRYSVPRGTYKGPDTYVRVHTINNEVLVILELDSDKELGRYRIPNVKGHLLKNNDHSRDKSSKIPVLINDIASQFLDPVKAESFLKQIRQAKPRYIRDQLLLIRTSIKNAAPETVNKALDFCLKNRLYSAVDFKDAVIHFTKEKPQITGQYDVEIKPLSPESTDKIKTKPQIRDISVYTRILKMNNS
jgi:transposase